MTNSPTLSQGRSYLAIPGPSVVPDEVQRAAMTDIVQPDFDPADAKFEIQSKHLR